MAEKREQNVFTEEDFNLFDEMIDAVSSQEVVVNDTNKVKNTIVEENIRVDE